MEVKDFVRESLIQISNGITEAQEHISNLGGIINPPIDVVNTQGDSKRAGQLENGHNVYTVILSISI